MRYIDKIMQYGIIYLLATTHSGNRGEVKKLEVFSSFVLAVAAGVVSYYICKWLDGMMGGK